MAFLGKRILITGASRGIGLEIAKRLSRDGCKIVLAAKTVKPHPKLPGTIYTASDEIKQDTKCHPQTEVYPKQVNLLESSEIQGLVKDIKEELGGLDVLINNASAIDNSDSIKLSEKKYDLIHRINSRGTFLMTKYSLPMLLDSSREGCTPQVLTMSPPLNLNPTWFKIGGTAYTISKYNMSMMSLGMAEEFRYKIAFNCLWPKTTIDTAATRMVLSDKGTKFCRSPEIMSEAAYLALEKGREVPGFTGNFLIDEELIEEAGMDPKKYNLGTFNLPDLYVGEPSYFYKLMEKFKKWVV